MKKWKLILPFLKYLFFKRSVIMKALYHTVVKQNRRDHVVKKYGNDKGLPQIDLLEVFPEFSGSVDCFTFLYGTSMPIDMALLRELAKTFPSCDYLEIGSWRGESLANLSPVCRSLVSVSLSDAEMNSMGYGEKFTRVQRLFSKGLKNVQHVEANSTRFDFKSLNKKFDLIFVDGDHSYEGVLNDTQKVFELLKDENSIIVWHDYVTNYEFIDWEVYAGILDGTSAEKRDKIYHIGNTYCAIYTNKKFNSKQLDFPTMPDKRFKLEIKSSRL